MSLESIKHYFKQLNCFPELEEFKCDSCQREVEEENAYSLARDWKEISCYPTYCESCLKFAEQELKYLRKIKRLRAKKYAKIDKRTLRKTGRTYQLGTRVRKEFLKKLRFLAKKKGLKYVEVLEKALDCYEREVRKI